MPWRETSPMDQKVQFIADFSKDRFSFTELCERYEISRKTGYKWVERYVEDGPGALEDLPRKPLCWLLSSSARKINLKGT
jgi:putative transposase